MGRHLGQLLKEGTLLFEVEASLILCIQGLENSEVF